MSEIRKLSKGRRKFLRPLYRPLQDNPQTRDRGQALYARARPGYHPPQHKRRKSFLEELFD